MGRPWRIFWALKLRIFRKFLGQMETGERPNCRFLACRWSKRLKRICRHVPWSYGQNHFCLQAHTTWNQLIEQNYFHQDWMSDDFQNISQLGLLFPVYGNIKNGPNHQPVYPWLHAYFHIPLSHAFASAGFQTGYVQRLVSSPNVISSHPLVN